MRDGEARTLPPSTGPDQTSKGARMKHSALLAFLPCTRPIPRAGSTDSRGTVPASVGCIERMAVEAMSLGGIQSGEGSSSRDVLAMCDRLQVQRVHAVPHATQMVERQTSRNGSNQQLVSKPMCLDSLDPRNESEQAVTIPVLVRSPQPTVSRPIDLRPEPMLHRIHGYDNHYSIVGES